MISLWVFLKAINPRTWLIVGLCGVLCYGGWSAYRAGLTHAETKARADILEGDKANAQKEATAYQVRMDASEKITQAAMATIAAQNVRLTVLDSRLANDRKRVTESVAQVAAIPDAQLFGDITQRIARRVPTDTAATFYPSELREIDLRLAELSPLQDQVVDLGSKVEALQVRSTAQDQNIAALQSERAALFLYASQLHDHYAKAYALAQPRVGLFVRIVTLGLKRTKKINLPAPAAIPVPAQ